MKVSQGKYGSYTSTKVDLLYLNSVHVYTRNMFISLQYHKANQLSVTQIYSLLGNNLKD